MDTGLARRDVLAVLAAGTAAGCLRLGSGGSADETTAGTTEERTTNSDGTPAETPTPTPTAPARIQVVGSTGTDIQDRRVRTVQLTVKIPPGDATVDLSGVTVQWVGPSGTYNLTPSDFAVEPIVDDDASLSDNPPTLDSPDDRATLTFDVLSFRDSGLSEGTAVSLTLVTRASTETMVRLNVPESLSGARVVQL